jgi:hypothetical protein
MIGVVVAVIEVAIRSSTPVIFSIGVCTTIA